MLRNGPRVTVGEVDITEDEHLDKEVRLTQGFRTARAVGDAFCELTSAVFDILCRGFWQRFVQQ